MSTPRAARAAATAGLALALLACDDAATVAPSAPASTDVPPQPAEAPGTPPAVDLRCAAPCPDGTSCLPTASGLSCARCAPGDAPGCDGETVVRCDDDGALAVVADCAAERRICDRGRCTAPECPPGRLFCAEGDIYRCAADGRSRTLERACVIEDAGGTDFSRGLCRMQGDVASCRTRCDLGDHVIAATRDCAACDWSQAAFCAEESPERGCTDFICVEGEQAAFGAVALPCWRDTEGLTVPGSEVLGACEPDARAGEGRAPVRGARSLRYQVCHGGQAVEAARVVPCAP